MANYPRITIVTPSYNQAPYLEATLKSVIDQNYPNLDYIVVDGGSNDGSVEIIKKYADHLSWWVSEPDAGQYDAINKGFARSTGEVMAWLNSDDVYFPWTLFTIGYIFTTFPEIRLITQAGCHMNSAGQVYSTGILAGGISQELLSQGFYRGGLAGYLSQAGTFWRRNLWEEAGGALHVQYKLAADFELWCRFANYARPVAANCLLSAFRVHPENQRSRRYKRQYEEEVSSIVHRMRPKLSYRVWSKLSKINKIIGLIYSYLFIRSASACIEYDVSNAKWVYHQKKRGRLYRLLVVGRKT